MDLLMTVGVQQQQIVNRVTTAVHPPVDGVVLPATFRREQLPTDRAASVLLQPQVPRFTLTQTRVRPRTRATRFEVRFPRGIKGIGGPTDLDMTAYPGLAGQSQNHQLLLTVLVLVLSLKHGR